VAARDRLQREEEGRGDQVPAAVAAQVAVDERQAERDPLDGREVQLGQAREARRRESEDDARRERPGAGDPELAREEERARAREHARQQDHHVEREHRVAARDQERGAHDRAADDVLRVGERARFRVEDVGVEDPQRLVQERVDVPGQRPKEEPRVRRERHGARRRLEAERERQHRRQQHEHADDGREPRPAAPAAVVFAHARGSRPVL
jgi:hypothetical protein